MFCRLAGKRSVGCVFHISVLSCGKEMCIRDRAKVENYKELGLNSETAVVFNITSKEQVIVNTW